MADPRDPNAYQGERADERIDRLRDELAGARGENARLRGERDQSVARLTRLRQGCPGPERWPDVLSNDSATAVVKWFGTEVEVPLTDADAAEFVRRFDGGDVVEPTTVELEPTG
jgi:hypothetical protein